MCSVLQLPHLVDLLPAKRSDDEFVLQVGLPWSWVPSLEPPSMQPRLHSAVCTQLAVCAQQQGKAQHLHIEVCADVCCLLPVCAGVLGFQEGADAARQHARAAGS